MADTRTRCCVAFFAFSLLALAGCGGGGSSTSAPTQATSPAMGKPPPAIPVNFQAANTTVAYQAAAVTAIGAKWGAATISQSGQGATVSLTTDTSGNLSGMTIPGQNNSTSGNSGLPLTDPGTLNFGYLTSDWLDPGETAWRLSQVASGQGLTSSAYGLWASVGKTQPGDDGAIAFGNLTVAASVPTTGSATFNGSTMGMGGADGGTIYPISGKAQIVANFATQTVTTSLTNFPAIIPGISIPDLTGTSTISGNGYAGPISGGGLSGTINGNFYGSSAQETAGVWKASGGGNGWIGSFGAKQ